LPFTFAHPLYAIPLKYIKPKYIKPKYISLSGLILGSMSPDFEYFIALEPFQYIGHTTKGLFLEAIPLCVILVILFRFIMKPFVLHLPSFFHINARVYNIFRIFDFRNYKNWLIFILSVIVGFYSHIFIDSFTHSTGHFVMIYPTLQKEYFSIPMYKLLQHFLSLAGMLIQLIIIFVMLIKASPINKTIGKVQIDYKQKLLYWLVVLVVVIALVTAKLLLSSSQNVLGIIVVSPISGFLFGILISSLLFYKTSK